jgi:predicted CXXCH cytochrome family protein
MKRMFRQVLLSFLALLLCGNASAVQLLYPLDGTYVTKSNYLVIKGGTDPYLSGFSIEINGVESDIIDVTSEAYRAAFGDMLILEPLFDPGVNKIVVEGYLGGEKMSSASATVFYHNQLDKAPPNDFTPEAFHSPEREEPCAACHNMQPSSVDLANPDPRTNPCGSCHVRMISRKHVHGPAGVFECTYCHDTDSLPNKYQARPGDADLCVECHEDKLDEYLQAEFVHGPVDAGLCLVCHDPHAGDEPMQLVLPAFELCSSCHEKIASEPHVTRGSVGKKHPVRGVTNPAGNGEDLSCASCHNPHSGATSALFRWGLDSRFSLCAKCHNK